jgi:hypothetical protein
VRWEEDPVVRLAALDRIAEAKRVPAELYPLAVTAGNDHVRQKVLQILAEAGGPGAAGTVGQVVRKILSDASGYANPNNMLCEAMEAAKRIADPGLVPALEAVLEKHGLRNNATFLAAEALVEIGEKHGTHTVHSALQKASKLQGSARAMARMNSLLGGP